MSVTPNNHYPTHHCLFQSHAVQFEERTAHSASRMHQTCVIDCARIPHSTLCRFSDKYPFRMRSETAEIAVELSLQPYKAFQTDGVIFFSDILTPLPAMGIEFDVIKGKGPLISNPVRSLEHVSAGTVSGELSVCIQTLSAALLSAAALHCSTNVDSACCPCCRLCVAGTACQQHPVGILPSDQ